MEITLLVPVNVYDNTSGKLDKNLDEKFTGALFKIFEPVFKYELPLFDTYSG
jgi:hypothetical protein